MNSVLKLLVTYVRTMLIEYQDSRRRCFDDDTLQLEQIHSIYRMSIFQGYSFGYQFNDQERLEVLINLNSFEATRMKDVKRFEVRVSFVAFRFFFDCSLSRLVWNSIKKNWSFSIEAELSLSRNLSKSWSNGIQRETTTHFYGFCIRMVGRDGR